MSRDSRYGRRLHDHDLMLVRLFLIISYEQISLGPVEGTKEQLSWNHRRNILLTARYTTYRLPPSLVDEWKRPTPPSYSRICCLSNLSWMPSSVHCARTCSTFFSLLARSICTTESAGMYIMNTCSRRRRIIARIALDSTEDRSDFVVEGCSDHADTLTLCNTTRVALLS